MALRTIYGTYVSAALDKQRVVQAAALGPTEVFEKRRVKEDGGGMHLRSLYGTCVSVWYDGTAHQNPHCGAWETFWLVRRGDGDENEEDVGDLYGESVVPGVGRGNDGVGGDGDGGRGLMLRTAQFGSIEIAHEGRRDLTHTRWPALRQSMQLVRVSAPPKSPTRNAAAVRVSGRWERGEAWCMAWSVCCARAVSSRPFNATSGTQYWEHAHWAHAAPSRLHAVGVGGVGVQAATTTAAEAVAAGARGVATARRRPLAMRVGDSFDVAVACEGGLVSRARRAWVATALPVVSALAGSLSSRPTQRRRCCARCA